MQLKRTVPPQLKPWMLTLMLAGLAMVGPFSIDTYLPSFTAIANDMGVELLLIQQTLSVYLFAFAAMMLFHGTLSDTFGRRPVVLGTLIVYILASLGAAWSPSLGWLLLFRGLQGASAGAGMVIGRAIVRDRLASIEAQRTLSHMTMVFGLAPAVAPIIGGYLQNLFGWQSVFLFLALFGFVMFAICYRLLPESLPVESRQPLHFMTIVRNYCKVLTNSQFRRLSLALGFAFSGFALYIASAPHFIMEILHLPETAFAWLFVPLVSGLIVGAWVMSRLAGKVPPLLMIRTGYSLMAAAYLMNVGYNYFFAAAVPWATLPIMLYTFGMAWVTPNVTLMILDLFADMRGMAASLQSFIQTLIFALVSGLVAPLLFGSALKLAVGGMVGLSLSFLCYLLAKPRPPVKRV